MTSFLYTRQVANMLKERGTHVPEERVIGSKPKTHQPIDAVKIVEDTRQAFLRLMERNRHKYTDEEYRAEIEKQERSYQKALKAAYELNRMRNVNVGE